MDENERIVYSLNVDDLQTVAAEVLGRRLEEHELKIVEDLLGDYIGWYEAIAAAIAELRTRSVKR
jgi:hypothetical protein